MSDNLVIKLGLTRQWNGWYKDVRVNGVTVTGKASMYGEKIDVAEALALAVDLAPEAVEAVCNRIRLDADEAEQGLADAKENAESDFRINQGHVESAQANAIKRRREADELVPSIAIGIATRDIAEGEEFELSELAPLPEPEPAFRHADGRISGWTCLCADTTLRDVQPGEAMGPILYKSHALTEGKCETCGAERPDGATFILPARESDPARPLFWQCVCITPDGEHLERHALAVPRCERCKIERPGVAPTEHVGIVRDPQAP